MPDLRGKGVLITRPEQQGRELAGAVERAGGRAFVFPALEIVAGDRADIDASLETMQAPDITLFVSPNAVRFGIQYADDSRIGAIGPATAEAVEASGLVLMPR